MPWLFVGTYPTGDGPGSGEGVWAVEIDLASGALGAPRLLVRTPAPSFLAVAPSGQRVYAVSEQTAGTVSAFRVTSHDGAPRLETTGTTPSGGADPCHVVAHDGELWLSNYSSGTFAVQVLDGDGDLPPGADPTSFEHAGTGPVHDRQEGPHAHSALATPGGRFAWVMDLGTDEVRRYRRDDAGGAGELEPDGTAVRFPPGTGPRHAVVHPDGTAFVVGELDCAVHVVETERASGGGVPVGSVPACRTPSREGVEPLPSHVALSADGTRLYVGVRGPDVVATFAVHARAGGGTRLEHLADTSVEGTWPRHFAVLRADDGADLVVVANQGSASVVVLRMDAVSGAGEVVSRAEVPAPACVVTA